VELLMMSCRAMGRGAIDALLAWLARVAAGAGATALRVPTRLDERNVPLRLALAAAGFRADPTEPDGDGRTHFARRLSEPLPELPDWATVSAAAP
jgi:predicted enzyme involved in methoxymalonyl-ACP biosynthesis